MGAITCVTLTNGIKPNPYEVYTVLDTVIPDSQKNNNKLTMYT